MSATTRAPREGEIDGVHYRFIKSEQFLQMVKENEFLEYAEYVGSFYGTPRGPVEDAMAQGRDAFLDIEIQGAQQVYEKRPDAVRIFIAPNSWAELERRLTERGTDSAREDPEAPAAREGRAAGRGKLRLPRRERHRRAGRARDGGHLPRRALPSHRPYGRDSVSFGQKRRCLF